MNQFMVSTQDLISNCTISSSCSKIHLDSTPKILLKFANVPVEILQSEIKLFKYLPTTDGKSDINTNNESVYSLLGNGFICKCIFLLKRDI
jgi:hypothetical protein